MSRETDNPPPGPLGWGEPQRSDGDGEPSPASPRAEEKTETTLTTRARINIPGSRPIPPIVVRETVNDPAPQDVPPPPEPGRGPRPGPRPVLSAGAGAAGDGGDGGDGGAGEKRTSSWFEPRKPPTPQGDTPPGGHPAVTETPSDGIPASWFQQPPDATPPSGVALPPPPEGLGLPPRPVGPTSGPATGEMPLPPVPGRPLLPAEEPAATTMDLGGPFPPPPPDVTATGPMAALTDPFTSGPISRVRATRPDGADGAGPVVPPPGPRSPEAVRRYQADPAPDSAEPAATPAPAPAPAAEPKPAAPRGKGRARLRLALIALAGLGVVAYGAGLFLSPEDVPQGTTVLGVDIGGLSSQDARGRLDAALERANNDPLTLRLGDQEVELSPSVAGLAVDTEATVQATSGQDYNPVSVIGSLVGAERTENAVFAVDREKLTVALEDAGAQVASGPVDGSITFESTGAIAHIGAPGLAVDVDAAADVVEAAFRERAATGRNPAIELPMSTREPQIDEAEVRRAMAEFAEPAMSGFVTVRAGTQEIQFSPQNSLYQFLGMQSVDGALVETYDLEVLEGLYGSTFADVLVPRADGSRTPVTPEDVVGVLREALRETDPARRVGVIDLDPS